MLGDRPQRRRVGRHRDRATARRRRRSRTATAEHAVRRPERDGVDGDPRGLRALRARERRQRAARLLAVGEEEDRDERVLLLRSCTRSSPASSACRSSCCPSSTADGERVADRGPAVRLEEVELVERPRARGRGPSSAARRSAARSRTRSGRPCTRFGTRSRNVRTAACAAPRRVGFTSVACIEPETSTTRMTVALSEATSVDAVRTRERDAEQPRARAGTAPAGRSGAASGRRRPTRARRGS